MTQLSIEIKKDLMEIFKVKGAIDAVDAATHHAMHQASDEQKAEAQEATQGMSLIEIELELEELKWIIVSYREVRTPPVRVMGALDRYRALQLAALNPNEPTKLEALYFAYDYTARNYGETDWDDNDFEVLCSAGELDEFGCRGGSWKAIGLKKARNIIFKDLSDDEFRVFIDRKIRTRNFDS